MALTLFLSLCSLGLLVLLSSAQVIDLDNSFDENKGEQSWLVMFYAPWCGHCRRLHPTFHQVSLELMQSDIMVGKVDATMFSSLASQYDVRGYPTIQFIKGDVSYTHRGERSKESIIEFAQMAHGPQIRKLASQGKFVETLNRHKHSTFYLYVGGMDEEIDLYKKYIEIAKQYPIQAYYYAGECSVLPSDIHMHDEPALLVFKDKTHFRFEGQTKSEMEKWIRQERFVAFPHVAEGGLNEMVDLNKKLVIVVTENNQNHDDQERLKNVAKSLVMEQREKYHPDFQFIWMSDVDTANSITMSHLSTPLLFVLDPDTYLHYISDTPSVDITTDTLAAFLQDVIDGKAEPLGGTSFGQRLKRLAWDVYSTVISIYRESPWLALIVFGIPGLVISTVCYVLCCLDPVDDTEHDEDDDDENDDELADSEKRLLEGEGEAQRMSGEKHMKKE